MGLVTVVGPPCSGKSTLSQLLTRVEPTRVHVSVGDLIRRDRDANRLDERSEDAYQGQAGFAPDYICRLIQSECERSGVPPERLVLEGGPPLGEVGDLLGVPAELSISLRAEVATVRARFERRLSTGLREDDTVSLFARRSAVYERLLPGTVEVLRRRGPLLELDAREPTHLLLLKTIDALAMVELMQRQNLDGAAQPGATIREDILDGPEEVSSESSDGGVLLIKPGVRLNAQLFRELQRRVSLHGLTVADVVETRGHDIRVDGLARAHFAEQYWYAVAGTSLLPHPMIGAFEIAKAHGADVLARWEDLRPRKIRRGLWVGRVSIDRNRVAQVANGHIPRVVSEFEADSAKVVAIRLVAIGGCIDWAACRAGLLGHTDPSRAAAGTLRGDAHRGTLETGMRVSFQNNGFHLSDSARAATRERLVWFRELGVRHDRDQHLSQVVVGVGR